MASKFDKIIKYLKLEKPLIIFDVTTTGPSISSDKIIHLAYIKIWPDGRVKKEEQYFNPEHKISPESIAIHGIRNRDIQDKPSFREKAQEIYDVFNDCHYSGFNNKDFDLPVLRREFVRVGMDFDYDEADIIDSKTIFHFMAPRTIGLAYEYYLGKEAKYEYNASTHTEMISDILLKQLEKYEEARNWDFIKMLNESENNSRQGATRKFYWLDGEAYFSFSKYKNQKLSSIVKKDKEFLKWVLDSDFSDDAKTIIRQALGNGHSKKEDDNKN